MANSFFQRWARRKAAMPRPASPAPDDTETEPGRGNASHIPEEAQSVGSRFPTLDDVACLSNESDFSQFISPGVNTTVRRAAMKKLFSNPQFNIIDGLDIYMGDYNKPDPIAAGMLAALTHTKNLFQLRAPENEHDSLHADDMNTPAEQFEEECDSSSDTGELLDTPEILLRPEAKGEGTGTHSTTGLSEELSQTGPEAGLQKKYI